MILTVAIYLKSNGQILRRVTSPLLDAINEAQFGEEFYLNCPSDATHIIDNEPVTITPEPIPPTEAEIVQRLTTEIQSYLDLGAQERNYDGILSLCSYATSLDPVFQAEGQAGVVWRDSVWRTSYQIMTDVKSGTRGVPTTDELLAELPTMFWP